MTTAAPVPVPASAWAAGASLALLAAVGLAVAGSPLVLAGAWLTAVATVLAIVDARSHRLPDRLLGPGAAGLVLLLAATAAATNSWAALGRAVTAAAVCATGYLLLALVRAGGLGLGDVKLAGLLGLWLGWWDWSAVAAGVLAGFVLGGAWALLLLVTRRARRDTAVAFGPWMILGAALATAAAAGSTA
ncbi:prepilin peptidase [Georgenia sp. TF02-10]|uniref:prepilin peptidase n=1 Tax=Georgenia sp. TF02-10 TaxID=2917725 RepID=UPI001FA71DDB|nr:prepilin peptidase [Georgenia sp. TF02-10]UNX53243.1 prepilin peptidase [Georgenia sp. TF02-10]